MESIAIPDILSIDEYRSLAPQLRERYVYGAIREIVKMNPNGVTLAQIITRVPFDRKTVSKHLEKLVAVNEAFTKSFGNTIAYYPNNRAIHPSSDEILSIGKKTFRFILIDNPLGKAFYVQEVVRDASGEEVKGGLIIPLSDLNEFMDEIKEFRERVMGRGDKLET